MDAKLFRQVLVHCDWLVYITETHIGRYIFKSPNTTINATNITQLLPTKSQLLELPKHERQTFLIVNEK